ncbi:MAG: hypothetical protein KL863_14430 [Rhizobium sp.]|nr:hypothetical protein [Rhizobium sp.]
MPVSNKELAGLMISGRGIYADYVSGNFVGYTGYSASFKVYDDDLDAIGGGEKGVKPTIAVSFIFDEDVSIFDLKTGGGTYVLDAKTLKYGTMETLDGERIHGLLLTAPEPSDPSVEMRFFIQPRGFSNTLDWDSFENAATGGAIKWSDYFIVTTGGTGGKDTFKSTEADERFFGFGGNDKATVGGGNDYLDGGAGVDTLDFGKLSQRISIFAPEPGESEYSISNGLTYINFENFAGSAFNDYVAGNSQNNVLAGRGGDDTLNGGMGADIFAFRTGDQMDTIEDFEASGAQQDRINLSGLDSVQNWKDLKKNHQQATEEGVSIDGGNGDILILSNVDVADLGKGDFIF